MRIRRLHLNMICMAMAISSCEHKEICFNHHTHALKCCAKVEAQYELEWHYCHEQNINWRNIWPQSFSVNYEELLPFTPEGLRAVAYDSNGTPNITNLPAMGGELHLKECSHSLLFYNNDTEYIVFDNLASHTTAKATTRTRTRSTYIGNSYMNTQSESTVNPPDVLFGHYVESYIPKKTMEPEPLLITMRPLVFKYFIRYEFSSGLKHVALARGALAGMAASVYLVDGKVSEEAATILYDCTVEDFGAQAIVCSFGICNFPGKEYVTDRCKCALNLEVKLRNGKLLSFDFDVTDQVVAQPQGGVIVVKNIEISDEESKGGSSGFDIDVEGWGEYKDIDMPL